MIINMKIAASDFLNTRPLIQGLERVGERLILESPFQCAESLERGEVDFALIPSIEYSRIEGLCIVPGISISSLGPVQSVILFLKKDLRAIKTIAVDERSRTAYNLLKILAKKVFQIEPVYETMAPDLDTMLSQSDGALLIGDQALIEGCRFGGAKIDLGEAWFQFTQLPFTFAFWAGRRTPVTGAVEKFQQAKEEGIRLCPQIARSTNHQVLSEDFVLNYLTRYICFGWSEAHERGLKLFFEWTHAYGYIEKTPELRFYECYSPTL